MTRYATGATNQGMTEETGVEPQSYLTNYTENSITTASHVLQTVLVSDDEMQAVVSPQEGEMECVVMPVETNEPLNPVEYWIDQNIYSNAGHVSNETNEDVSMYT